MPSQGLHVVPKNRAHSHHSEAFSTPLDPDADLHCESYANEPWSGLRLILGWTIGAVVGWAILALAGWTLFWLASAARAYW